MKKREIPALLRPQLMDLDFSVLAEMIRQQGRGRDKILAHITPQEAALLKKRGGRGSINPQTGLPEFEEEWSSGYDLPQMDTGMAEPMSFDVGPGQTATEAYQQFTGYQPAVFPEFGLSSGGGGQQLQAQTGPATGLRMPSEGIPGIGGGGALGGAPQQPGFFDTAAEKVKNYFTDPKQGTERALRAAGLLGTGLFGALQSRRAGQQGEAMSRQLSQVGSPYKAMGEQLIGMGQRGELTAPQQQALQTMKAQTQQQLARAGVRGGTIPMQAQAAIQRQAEVFAQQNINEGIKLLNIADQYTTQGIKASYQSDADARNLAMRFFSSVMQQVPQSAPGAVQSVPANRVG
jgi:hypothetical protein